MKCDIITDSASCSGLSRLSTSACAWGPPCLTPSLELSTLCRCQEYRCFQCYARVNVALSTAHTSPAKHVHAKQTAYWMAMHWKVKTICIEVARTLFRACQ